MIKRLRLKFFLLFIILAGLGLVFALLPNHKNNSEIKTSDTQIKSENSAALFVVAHPFDLNQIDSITKYRSCFGHNYGNKTVDGETEDNRSMKHYLNLSKSIVKSGKEIPVYAPFDGEISDISSWEDFGYDVWLTPNQGFKQWYFILFHISLDQGLKKGSKIQAGKRIGRVQLTPGGNFDMAVKKFKPFSAPVVDVPLKHFAPNILADYEARGITLENSIISKKYRDQNPCPVIPGTEGRDARFPSEAAEGEIIFLRHR